jgi:hypothetical protein
MTRRNRFATLAAILQREERKEREGLRLSTFRALCVLFGFRDAGHNNERQGM